MVPPNLWPQVFFVFYFAISINKSKGFVTCPLAQVTVIRQEQRGESPRGLEPGKKVGVKGIRREPVRDGDLILQLMHGALSVVT